MDEAQVRSIGLFASLSGKERKLIASQADDVDVAEGQQLVREGEFAYEFFVIVEGTAEVTRSGEHVADLGPGDFLGEMGIVGQTRRNASVVATSPMRVMVMSEQNLRGIMRQMPAAADRIIEEIEERSRSLTAPA